MSTSKKFFLGTPIILFFVLLALLARHFYPIPTPPPLPEQNFDSRYPNIVKYAQTGAYEVFTLSPGGKCPPEEGDTADQTSCDSEISACMNIITKDREITLETVETIGSFYKFTPRGVIFRYVKGEGIPCSIGREFFTTYYDFPTKKRLYGIYSEFSKGTPVDPQYEFCETITGEREDIQRTTTTGRQFFDYPYFNRLGDENKAENLAKMALNIQADSIEEAFEAYYTPLLTPSECNRPDIQIGDFVIQACNIGSINTETEADFYEVKYKFTEVETICPLGYHVPTGEEWSKLLIQRHSENPSHGGKFGTNGTTAWILDWSQEDMENFQKSLKLPKKSKEPTVGISYLSSSKSSDFPRGVYFLYFDTDKVEIQNYSSEGSEMLVRCFKDKN